MQCPSTSLTGRVVRAQVGVSRCRSGERSGRNLHVVADEWGRNNNMVEYDVVKDSVPDAEECSLGKSTAGESEWRGASGNGQRRIWGAFLEERLGWRENV